MAHTEDYSVDLSASPNPDAVAACAEAVFERVWRFDFGRPGFCPIDLGPGVGSRPLRLLMVELKHRLSDLCARRTSRALVFRSMGRFDQQETTRFHRDGAPEESLLMLGYEPSPVRSRLFLADYTRCAFDRGLTPQQFLQEHNPMFTRNEPVLQGYVTELHRADSGRALILLINNSAAPFAPDGTKPLGVLHKAEIVNPSASERRIVNSVMLEAVDAPAEDRVTPAEQQEFLRTDRISEKNY